VPLFFYRLTLGIFCVESQWPPTYTVLRQARGGSIRFPLSLHMVEEMLAARSISVADETIRQ
jgi:hypothetical protein